MGGESGRVKEKMGETRKVERFLCKYLPLICNKCATDTAVNALASILLTHKTRAHTCNKALHTRDSSWATPDPTHLIILQLFAQRLFAYQIKEGTIATEARKAGKLGKTAKQTNAKSIRVVQAKFGHNSYQ